MKTILAVTFLLLSVSSFGQKVVSLWEFSHTNKTIQVGDTAFVRIGYQPSYFSDTDTMKIRTAKVVNTSAKYFILFKSPFSELNTYPKNPDSTITIKFIITGDVIGETPLLITALKETAPNFTIIEKVLSINPQSEAEITYSYFDLFGNEIKNPVNGFYIYRTNTGNSGKIFIP